MRECRQQSWPSFNQYDARGAGVDTAEVGGQCLPRNICNRAGHLDAGSAATDDYESEQAPPFVLILYYLRSFKRDQDAAPDTSGILYTLQAWRIVGPVVMTR